MTTSDATGLSVSVGNVVRESKCTYCCTISWSSFESIAESSCWSVGAEYLLTARGVKLDLTAN